MVWLVWLGLLFFSGLKFLAFVLSMIPIIVGVRGAELVVLVNWEVMTD